jgi:hypothetical protein
LRSANFSSSLTAAVCSTAKGPNDQARTHSTTEIAIQAKPINQPNVATALIIKKAELETRPFHRPCVEAVTT